METFLQQSSELLQGEHAPLQFSEPVRNGMTRRDPRDFTGYVDMHGHGATGAAATMTNGKHGTSSNGHHYGMRSEMVMPPGYSDAFGHPGKAAAMAFHAPSPGVYYPAPELPPQQPMMPAYDQGRLAFYTHPPPASMGLQQQQQLQQRIRQSPTGAMYESAAADRRTNLYKPFSKSMFISPLRFLVCVRRSLG